MQKHEIYADMATLHTQLIVLKNEMDKAITEGKNFIEVKTIHLQIKELNRLINQLQMANQNIARINNASQAFMQQP